MTTFTVDERTSRTYTATLTNENGAAIALSDLASMTLTLYDKAGGTIINSRNAQNALNANNVTIHATDGTLTWQIQPADNAIVGTEPSGGPPTEPHIALFQWTYASGAKAGKHQIQILVRNLGKVS